MSSEIILEFIDNWDALVCIVRGEKECEKYSVRLTDCFSHSSYSSLAEFLEFLEAMYLLVPDSIKTEMEEVFFKIFDMYFLSEGIKRKWKKYGAGINDLPLSADETNSGGEWEALISAISPSSVRDIYRFSSRINFNDYEKPFEQAKNSRKRGNKPDIFREFSVFKIYVQSWLDHLKLAAEKKEGLLVSYSGS
jgi:hypothetical protein